MRKQNNGYPKINNFKIKEVKVEKGNTSLRNTGTLS